MTTAIVLSRETLPGVYHRARKLPIAWRCLAIVGQPHLEQTTCDVLWYWPVQCGFEDGTKV
jgi:hypothetical protein